MTEDELSQRLEKLGLAIPSVELPQLRAVVEDLERCAALLKQNLAPDDAPAAIIALERPA